MKMLSLIAGILLLTSLLQPAAAAAVTLGQTDNFQNGTTQGWIVGDAIDNPVPPVIVPDGGPNGTGDKYMLLTADGGSGVPGPDPGSRLAVINQTQWTGNYPIAGINAITMWVNNLGTTDLFLRLYLADGPFRAFNNAGISTNAVFLPAGSGWRQAVFPISVGDLTATRGNPALALANAKELRLFHNPNPTFPGPAVVASLGVDNITALRLRFPLPYLPLLLLDD